MLLYQFHVDGRPAAPVRDEWEDAARDAVSAGYATWKGSQYSDEIYLNTSQRASIKRIKNA